MLAGGLFGPAILLLYLVLNVPLLDVYNVHWATYVNGFYDTRAAKRIVPVLGTAARLAGIIAGLSMPFLNRLVEPGRYHRGFVCHAGGHGRPGRSHAAPAPRTTRRGRNRGPSPGPRRLRARAPVPAGGAGTAARLRSWVQGLGRAHGANLREGYQQIRRSRFLLWMALSTLSMTLLLVLLNYQASAIFQAELKTTVQISNFLGVLSGVANLVVLPIQLFLLSRLISRLGLATVSLVYPLASLAAAGSLVVAPGLATAAFAYVDRTALRTAFRLPTENLLYNAVPLRVKARTRAFVGGLLVPLGTILGGLMLLTPLARTSWFLPAAILALGLAFALAALMVRRHYGRALVALLEQEDYSSLAVQEPSLQAPATLPLADPATLARLAQKLRESTSPEYAVFMARLICEIGGEAAVPIVGQAARAATDSRLRALLVDVLVAADVRRGEARELYAALLADSRQAGAPVGNRRPGADRWAPRSAVTWRSPPACSPIRSSRFGCASCPPSWRPTIPAAAQRGAASWRALLKARNPHTRARALHVVGQARASGFLPEVVRSLADGADEVRLAAALAAETLVGGGLPGDNRDALLSAVVALLQDPVERARMAAVTVLGRLSHDAGRDAPAAREGLIAGLADPSPEVREQAVEALARAGPQAIPRVHEQLSGTDPQLRKMAAVVLARIEPRKYAPLVRGPELNGNLLAIYRNLGCVQALAGCPGPAVAVLGRALRERNAALLDEIFYLLATIQDPAAVKTIAGSLRSPQPLVRANAAEALESLTAPQTATLVAPLFEPDLPPAQLLAAGRASLGRAYPDGRGGPAPAPG